MPRKILTDQPQQRPDSVTVALTTSNTTLVEAPYFSIPITGEPNDPGITVDPADSDRELRPGEVFIGSQIALANTGSVARTVTLEVVREGGAVFARTVWVPPNDTRLLPPGFRLFKRDLGNPSAAGDLMRARLTSGAGVSVIFSVIEREALEHAPDTEA